jgi:cyclophilin family peptidyl-prolyl cis-trans isomerase
MKKSTTIILISSFAAIIIAVGLIWSGTTKTTINSTHNTNVNSNASNNQNTNKVLGSSITKNTNNKSMTYSFPGILASEKIDNKKAIIQTSKGIIEFSLKSKEAPQTVSNFVYLAEKGFYDGLTFHRVVADFVIQGGDPLGTGQGGPGYEFEDEEVKGDYIEGAVAMANSGANTNGSQFFITLTDQTGKLPKQYNLFGQVTKGMEVVKKITVGDTIERTTIVNQ